MAGMTALANKPSYKLGAFWEKTSCMENSLKDATEQKALGIVPERPSGSTACGTWEQRQVQVKDRDANHS